MILLALFFQFLKIGAFTFGGGYAMIPLIEQTVTAEGWLSKQEIIDFVGVSEVPVLTNSVPLIVPPTNARPVIVPDASISWANKFSTSICAALTVPVLIFPPSI